MLSFPTVLWSQSRTAEERSGAAEFTYVRTPTITVLLQYEGEKQPKTTGKTFQILGFTSYFWLLL